MNGGATRSQDEATAPRGTARSPRRSWRRLVALALGALGAMVLGTCLYGALWYEGQVHAGPPGAQVILDVARGSSVNAVARQLAGRHVTSSSLALRIYDFFHGTPVVDAGLFAFRRHESLADVQARLKAGPNVLEVPAGFTAWETAERLDQLPGHDGSRFSAAVDDRGVVSPYEPAGTGNLDGLLAPGDYVVGPHESAPSLLSQMVTRFDTEAAAARLSAGAAALGVTPYQAVIVASIVEKEGVYPQNLAKVARVVYNRLSLGMPLQMDSTVLYALHQDGGLVTPADERIPSPYNTYLNTGLPPTPICFPSPAALAAALHPAAGSWLYFVLVSSDGTEAFSDTLAQQEANEQLAESRGLP